MPRLSFAPLPRRAVIGAAALAACLGAPAAPAAAADLNACLYSFDQEWREVDVVFAGTTSAQTAGGQPIASPATPLAPGDKVTFSGGTLSATLPEWVAKFGYEGGFLQDGSEFPIEGWFALDATNTVEGVTEAIRFTTTARVSIAFDAAGEVDEARSTVTTDPVALPSRTWTAAGGTVRVHQAFGDVLGSLPVGRNGSMATPEGSLAVKADVADDLLLTLECLPGSTQGQGLAGLAEAVPNPLGLTWSAPAYTASLFGLPATDPVVDAEIVRSQPPARGAVGTAITVPGSTLELRLSDEQRDAWLGTDPEDHPITAAVMLAASDATPAAQAVTATGTLADGSATAQLQLPTTTWTRTGESIAGLRPSGAITLRRAGRPDLVLTPRAGGPGVFATLHRSRFSAPVAPGTGGDGGGGGATPDRPSTTNPPSLGNQGGFLAPPKAVVKPAVATVRSSVLKPRRQRLSLKLTNSRGADSRVRITLRTKSKVKLGSKRKVVTIASARTVTLKAGRRTTVKLTLSKDARALLRRTKQVTVRATITPVGSTTTAPTNKALKLKR